MKSVIAVVTVCFILLAFTAAPTSINVGRSQETRVMQILNAETGANATVVGNDVDPMPLGGIPFTVNVTLEGTTDLLFIYQVAIAYNPNLVKCTGAWINKDDPAFVFSEFKDNVVIPPEPDIDNFVGFVDLGASLIGDQTVNVSSGLLAQINFTAIKRGDSMLKVIPTGDIQYSQYADSFLSEPYPGDYPQYITFTTEDLSLSTSCGPSAPVAYFSYQPENPSPNSDVTFDAKGSYDPYGNITSYIWNFGDGNLTTINYSGTYHDFASIGVYLVNLTVLNDFAYNASYQFSNSVIHELQVGELPFVNFTYEPVDLMEGTEATFNASLSHAANGTIATYSWNFGDGTTNTTDNSSITHAFATKGAYNVQLTVTDQYGLHNSANQTVQVGGLPTVSFTFTPTNPDVEQLVTFNATMSKAANESDRIVTYVWDFGDGNVTQLDASTPYAATPQHAYQAGGTYPVNLTVYDNNGLHNSEVQEITVGNQGAAAADYTLYVIIGVVIAIIIVVASVLLYMRSKPKRHTPKPSKTSANQGTSKT